MKHLLQHKIIKKGSRVGLVCNQTAWHSSVKKYSFELLAEKGLLRKVFIPEHGLFAELQDQEKLNGTSAYTFLLPGVEWISLYGSDESSLTASVSQLKDLDVLIIDIQDAGSRYYTFISTVWFLLKTVTEAKLALTVVVLDKPNPAGRTVEGTQMTEAYASFIGLEGLPHRHGLTIGELCRYFKKKLGADWDLIVDPLRKKDFSFIPPSPNIPAPRTCLLYSGQCLWEGTNISEGRGTTLPFELFGAPFLEWIFRENWNNRRHPVHNKYVQMRPTRFIPVFHKHANHTCSGVHLVVIDKKKYHSLAHSLQLLKFIKDRAPEFAWKEGKYEAFNDRNAIELLVGDSLILDYFENKASWKDVKEKLAGEEAAWIKAATPWLIYKSSLQQLKIK